MRDQAETFLLRLQRGSGLFGLSSMMPVSQRDGVLLIRPLLDVLPEDLKKYCKDKNIEWVEDPMNDDEDFVRVKIRIITTSANPIILGISAFKDCLNELLSTLGPVKQQFSPKTVWISSSAE